jgi:NAD+ synthase
METQNSPQKALAINADLVKDLLVRFLRDETRNAGFQKGVIGISGGVDSAVSAFLAAEALGAKNTTGVVMPHASSNSQSVKDAQAVVDQLGIRSEVVDISPMVDSYCDRYKITDRVRRGNVMARTRMIVLYDISAREKGLVIGTSNKTELLVGYGTLFGDTASALNPLGDLYKTQVWQLARKLGVPDAIVGKKPSADLWEGQTDEQEIGFPYARLDALLYHLIDERRSEEELKDLGFERAFIARVKELVRKSQFKRLPPVIAKLSSRTINVDFRYIRDWGI